MYIVWIFQTHMICLNKKILIWKYSKSGCPKLSEYLENELWSHCSKKMSNYKRLFLPNFHLNSVHFNKT